MGILQLDIESDMFSVSNSSSNGSSTNRCSLSNGNTTGQTLEGFVGIAVSGLACFILLKLLFAFELYYICRFKTTFLQRLFFYFTLAAATTEVAQMVVFALALKTAVICNLYSFSSLVVLLIHAYFAELLLIGSID